MSVYVLANGLTAIAVQRFMHLLGDPLGLAIALYSQDGKLRTLASKGESTDHAELEMSSLREVERLQNERLVRQGRIANPEVLWRPTVALAWGTVERVAPLFGVDPSERSDDLKRLRLEIVEAVPLAALDWHLGSRVEAETTIRGRPVVISLEDTHVCAVSPQAG